MGIVEVTLSMSLNGYVTFTFVPDVATAVARAKEVAGDKNVYLMGGASTANQALRAGLVDELNLHIEPVLLSRGARLFDDLGEDRIRLERVWLLEGPVTTHVRFRVLRSCVALAADILAGRPHNGGPG